MANIPRIGASAVVAAMVLASCGGASSGGPKATGTSTTGLAASTTTSTSLPPSALLLGGADLAGYSATSQEAPTPIPCGSHFADPSTTTTHASASFATSGSQQTVNETVAVYPSATAAAAVAAAFRTAGSSCAQFDDTQGPTRTYQVQALTTPGVTADDVVAVALASPAYFYDLVLLRSGSRLAWLALGQIGNPVDPAVLTSVASAAAGHLSG